MKTGQIYLNNVEISKVNYSHYIGYVQQQDILPQSMTVKE